MRKSKSVPSVDLMSAVLEFIRTSPGVEIGRDAVIADAARQLLELGCVRVTDGFLYKAHYFVTNLPKRLY